MQPPHCHMQSAARWLIHLSAWILLFQGSTALAATSCGTDSCAAQCDPTPPVAISTLVPASEFPSGATTPIAFIDPVDGTDRRFIVTQQGAILLWRGAEMAIEPTPYLDLRSGSGGPVTYGGERGLLSMAVDPDFSENGLFYVFYTRVNEGTGTLGDVVIERYQQSLADPDTADPLSASRIMIMNHSSASNHNGGTLAFGPDGFLYISTGDGGSRCDNGVGASGDGQSPGTLAGKMLRIDVRGIDPEAGSPDDCGEAGFTPDYMVPSTNPFFGMEPACDEVWALGLRNPFRFSFDRLTGDLYIADVGQDNWEEINILPASAVAPRNFGWVCREGCASAAASTSSCSVAGCPADGGTTCEFPRSASDFWDPALCHSNPQGWESVIAGYRYRGVNVPSLAGDFIYGDANCGQIWKTDTLDPANQAAVSSSCWASGYQGTYSFAEDHLGELYVVLGGAGRIDCIHNGDGCTWATGGPGLQFEDGFEAGEAMGLVINEVDYDQPGTDTAEFIEVFNGSSSPVDLTAFDLVLVNGVGEAEYERFALSDAAAVLPAGGYLVVGNQAVLDVLPGGVPNILMPNVTIQNGAPDGIALVNVVAAQLWDALSYEGEITMATISGLPGTVSLVEGSPLAVADSGVGSLSRIPNGTDTDDAASDWAATATVTPGEANVGGG